MKTASCVFILSSTVCLLLSYCSSASFFSSIQPGSLKDALCSSIDSKPASTRACWYADQVADSFSCVLSRSFFCSFSLAVIAASFVSACLESSSMVFLFFSFLIRCNSSADLAASTPLPPVISMTCSSNPALSSLYSAVISSRLL